MTECGQSLAGSGLACRPGSRPDPSALSPASESGRSCLVSAHAPWAQPVCLGLHVGLAEQNTVPAGRGWRATGREAVWDATGDRPQSGRPHWMLSLELLCLACGREAVEIGAMVRY